MATRIAVTTILICITVMLFSACGLPMLIPPANPNLNYQTLILWQQHTTEPPNAIAYLSLYGSTSNVKAHLRVLQSPCSSPDQIELIGSINRATAPTLALHNAQLGPDQPKPMRLSGTLAPQHMVYTASIAPLEGELTFPSGCKLTIHGREAPKLFGEWRGTTDSRSQPIHISHKFLFKSGSRTFSKYETFISLDGAPCFSQAVAQSQIRYNEDTAQFSTTYTIGPVTTLTAETTIDVLAHNTPLHTRYTIHGGPCDGQTFTATLRHN
jgi:hypothetical protein